MTAQLARLIWMIYLICTRLNIMKMSKYAPKPSKILLSLSALAMLLIPVFSVLPARAAVNAHLSLSPASKTMTVGDDVVVYIMLDTGGNSVLAWKAALTYSTSAFNAVTVATGTGSHFTESPVADVASGGTIRISRYATSASSADETAAKITLHSTGVGNTAISFAHVCSPTNDATPCSGVTDSSGTNLLSGVTGATFIVSAVPVAGSTTTPAAKAKKKSLLGKVADAVAGVVSPSTEATSPDSGLSVSRGSVKISVQNQKNKPVEGAKVTLAGESGVTDKNGKVLLQGLYPGEAKGTIVYKEKTQKITVDVQEGTSAYAPQLVSFTFKTGGSMVFPILFLLVIIAVVIGLIDLVFISKGGFKENVDHLLHHGNGGGHVATAAAASPATTTKHAASKSHDRHDPMTPGLIVSPNTRGDDYDWKS